MENKPGLQPPVAQSPTPGWTRFLHANWYYLVGGVLVLLGIGRAFGLFGGTPLFGEPRIAQEGEVISEGFVPVVIPVTGGEDPAQVTLEPGSTPNPDATAIVIEGKPVSMPERIVIPLINVDGQVVPAVRTEIRIGAETFEQWKAPEIYAAGWHTTSAWLGQIGNTVLNGHHNVRGMVFKDLSKLEVGDVIYVYGQGWRYEYKVTNTLILREDPEGPQSVRLENARWLLESEDERLTLVSCWPPESSSHRIIIVAAPAGVEKADE